MGRYATTLFENNDVAITRYPNRGRSQPGGILISYKNRAGRDITHSNRKLFVTIDELFTLTEELDDICDAIEDEEARSAPRNRPSDGLAAMG